MALKIKINKNTHSLTFGYLCLKKLGVIWGLTGVQSIINKVIEVFSNIDENDVAFDQVDLLVDIVNSALDDSVTPVDGDWLFNNMDQIGPIVKAFLDSLPKPEPEKKK